MILAFCSMAFLSMPMDRYTLFKTEKGAAEVAAARYLERQQAEGGGMHLDELKYYAQSSEI